MWYGWFFHHGLWERICQGENRTICAAILDKIVCERWGRPKNNQRFGLSMGSVPHWKPK